MFPTVQTYADGEVVRWNQPTPDTGAEPEHPAPVLDLSAPPAESGHGSEAEGETDLAVVETGGDSAGSDGTGSDDVSDAAARALAAGGLVAGVVALGSTLIRRRREGGD
jgi:hypothetical protein